MTNTIIRASEMPSLTERREHPLDAGAVRQAYSLGDAAGLTRVGLHFTQLKPGHRSTLEHRHALGDEFIVILSGTPTAISGASTWLLGPGDFWGLPAGSGETHTLENRSSADVTYLIGGDRPAYDIVEYPAKKSRAYLWFNKAGKRVRDFVSDEAIETK